VVIVAGMNLFSKGREHRRSLVPERRFLGGRVRAEIQFLKTLCCDEKEEDGHFTQTRNLVKALRMGCRFYLLKLFQFGNGNEKFCITAIQTDHNFLADINRWKNCPL
jgi:hypothetical protein